MRAALTTEWGKQIQRGESGEGRESEVQAERGALGDHVNQALFHQTERACTHRSAGLGRA